MEQSYRELQVWKKSVQLVKTVYLATAEFPADELYGLRIQMRRAAVAIPSNIAEGQSRLSQKELLHFLSNAKGSLAELETQLTVSNELCLLGGEITRKLLKDCGEIGRLLSGLYDAIELRAGNREPRSKR